MDDVVCRGSFALGTACGKCSKCRAQKEKYYAAKSVHEKMDDYTALQARVAELEKANGHLRNNIRGLKRNIFRKTQRAEAAEALLVQAREEWLEANDPGDGTDCVTPYDRWFHGRPST